MYNVKDIYTPSLVTVAIDARDAHSSAFLRVQNVQSAIHCISPGDFQVFVICKKSASSFFLMCKVNSHNAHVLDFFIKIILLVMCDVNSDGITEKLVYLFQGEAFSLLCNSAVIRPMTKNFVPLERPPRPL